MNRIIRLLLSLSTVALLAACGTTGEKPQGMKIGKPYNIGGRTYSPAYNPTYDEIGTASWYGPGFHGGRTASGERYDQNELTAAHKTLPLPSIVRVTNLDNGRSIIVRINDRGPFVANRIIDLSKGAASKLGVIRTGTARVRVQFLDQETRQYVSNLPNGREALHRLDMLAEKEREKTGNPHPVIELSELGPPTDDQPLPFVSPVYPPEKVGKYYADKQAVATAPKVEKPKYEKVSTVAEPSSVARTTPMSVTPAAYVTDHQPASASNANGKAYFIQAGTFGVRSNADRLLSAVSEISNAQIVESTQRNKTFYRVLAGPYSSRQDAENILSKLDTAGISGAKIIRD